MHELSLACELVDIAEAAAAEAGATGVTKVRLRLGTLAGVEQAALRIGYLTAIEGTLLAGSELEIVDSPARGWCPRCKCEVEPLDVQWIACPNCMAPLANLRSGREIEIDSLDINVPDEFTDLEETAPASLSAMKLMEEQVNVDTIA